MPEDIFVDADALLAAVDGAVASSEEMSAARLDLGSAEERMSSAMAMPNFGGTARHKLTTFTRQWCEEYQLIAQGLVVIDAIVREVASTYKEQESALVAAIEDAMGRHGD